MSTDINAQTLGGGGIFAGTSWRAAVPQAVSKQGIYFPPKIPNSSFVQIQGTETHKLPPTGHSNFIYSETPEAHRSQAALQDMFGGAAEVGRYTTQSGL